MICGWVGIECGFTPWGVLVRDEASHGRLVRTDYLAPMAKRKALWADALVEAQLHARQDGRWAQDGRSRRWQATRMCEGIIE